MTAHVRIVCEDFRITRSKQFGSVHLSSQDAVRIQTIQAISQNSGRRSRGSTLRGWWPLMPVAACVDASGWEGCLTITNARRDRRFGWAMDITGAPRIARRESQKGSAPLRSVDPM